MTSLKFLLAPLMLGSTLLLASPAIAHETMDGPGQISVSATGNSYQAPDLATVSAGVVTQATNANDAMQANAEKMKAIFDALEAAGIQKRHIKTSQLSLNPQYDYKENRNQPRIIGYQARNTVSAKSENLERVGPMIDALVSAGANNINGVSFGIKDSVAAKSKARKSAVVEARRKAEEMAEAAGLSLGRVLRMNENTHSSGLPQRMANVMHNMDGAAAGMSTSISGGEQTLSVTVNITFEIGE